LDTGARVGEALKVQWKDIQNNMVTFWDTKNNTSRSIPLTSRLSTLLQNKEPSGPFLNINYNELHYVWGKAKEALGLANDEEFVPHCLRHTCASRLVQSGVPILTAKEFLGHKSVNITMRYAHLAPQNLKEAIKALEKQ
jgi:integrase